MRLEASSTDEGLALLIVAISAQLGRGYSPSTVNRIFTKAFGITAPLFVVAYAAQSQIAAAQS